MNPTQTTLSNPTTGMVATPNTSTTPEQMAAAQGQGFVTSGFSTSPIAADSMGQKSSPIVVPQNIPSSMSYVPNITPPPGVTTDKNGTAIFPTPTSSAAPSSNSSTDTQSWIRTQLANLGNSLTGKSAATADLQKSTGLDEKTMSATHSYNAYNQAKLDLAQKIESMHSQAGGTTGGNAQAIAVTQREGNANLANLAVQAQVDQGLLSAAQDTIKSKLDAQFQPIQDQIDFLTKFNSVNNNDLTESEKLKLTQKADQLKTDNSNVQDAAQKIHDSLLKAGASPAAYSAVDKISNDYVNGKITASQAQSQMYAAASKYALTASKSYVPGADPVADSWISAVLNGNATMTNVPAAYKNQVALGMNSMPAEAYTPLAASRFTTAASRITNQFTNMAAYKLTADGQVYLDRINAALKTPGSVSDQDLLDSLTKLNTGGNAISDAQVKLVTDGKSFSDMVSTFKNKFNNGGVLSENQRKQISTIANSIFENYRKSYDPIYKQASTQLTAAGVPKAFWTIPDLNNLSEQRQGTIPEKTVKSNGQDYVVGQVYNDGTANWTIDAAGQWIKQATK